MDNTYIGFDFSIKKPAATVYHNGILKFFVWPENISSKSVKMLKDADITVFNRNLIWSSQPKDVSELMQYNLLRSSYLAKSICDVLSEYLHENTYIAQEGLSYGSSGSSGLELSGYKYILMHYLSKYTSYNNMFTYSPITIKSIANCSKKGEGTKDHMIESFKKNSIDSKFKNILINNPSALKKKTNYVECTDDIVDSYFVLKTMIEKNFENIIL
ncbi:MAG: hypothetical protein RSE41_07670 [Clostridia bacterium]